MRAYFQLMRPANIITAWADILAGIAASGFFTFFHVLPLAYLILATSCLYGGGVVLNDAFDADLDMLERPERPIPSGKVSRKNAFILGYSLLTLGLVFASLVSSLSALLAVLIAVSAVLYDVVGKHHQLGSVNMGICRGANLLLGISIVPSMVSDYWFLALIPIIYITAITNISRGEVYGGSHFNSIVSMILILIVFTAILGLGFLKNYHLLAVLPLTVFLAIKVLLPLFAAIREPSSENIRIAVRTGIISLIILNSTFSAGFAGFSYGLLVLSLLPVSTKLAQIFAVT
jgi:4-hydroxybenzoate polyprenyltransferase